MKKLLPIILLFFLYSCEEDIQGDYHTTWLFWFYLLIFVLLIIYLAISGNTKDKKDKERMKKDGIDPTKFIRIGCYVGGHPQIDTNIQYCTVYKKKDDLIVGDSGKSIYPLYKGAIPLSSIKEILLEDATTIENKVTLGRVILVGIFALAWRKKKKNELSFVTIQWTKERFNHTTIFSFEGSNAMQTANKVRNRLLREITAN